MSESTSIWFATPAFGRFAVTDLALTARAWLRDELAPEIELHSVLVAGDKNLSIASEHGFDTLERDNEWLGRRWNDGFSYALAHGADFVCPVDSDGWVHPDYLRACSLDQDIIASGNLHSQVSQDGHYLLVRDVWHPFALGPLVIPRAMLERLDGRPIREDIKRGVSTSIYRNLRAEFARLRWEHINEHELQYIGTRSGNLHQITQGELDSIWKMEEYDQPGARLREKWPEHLVAKMEAHYAGRRGWERG